MLHKLSTFALASALMVSASTGAFAAGTDHAALAPGKPAGVKEARLTAPLWVYIVGVGFVAVGIGFLASGNSNGSSTGTTSSTHL